MSERSTYQSLRKALTLFDLLVGDEFQTKAALGTFLGLDPRTVKGYIDVLEEFGWPVERSRRGFRLSPTGAAARFSEDDLLLLAILLAHGAATLPPAEFERLSRKLESLLPETSVSKVREFHDKVEHSGGRSPEIQVLAQIGRCLSDARCQIVADYQKTDGGEPQRRILLPIKLRYQHDCCYVDCHDLEKGSERSFRLDRFVKIQIVKQDIPLSKPESKGVSTHKWDFGDAEVISVSLQVTDRLARWLRQNPEHPSQDLEQHDCGWIVTYQVRHMGFLLDWVMSLRGAKALSPPELVNAVQARCSAVLQTGGTLEVEWG